MIAPDTVLRNIEDLLYFNAFNTDEMETGALDPIHRGVLYFIVHRVIPENKFSYYKDIFRHVECLCSTKLDGLLRQTDIRRLPTSLRSTMQVIFTRFSRMVDVDEVSFC